MKNGWNRNWDLDKNPGAEGLNACIYLFAVDQHDCLGLADKLMEETEELCLQREQREVGAR